ncbi:hypothetical protein QBC40DRAFT_297735 [Triangularia verruculosa]|uniref:Uncharacterized protein n=1 Tax=Triangularia verruculosa TaxID=2587418 RepID=A0AAN6XFF2_9PEZI|nr:hypothetical protein QBC40DRAFT_297735 [Triangularia verruculosa]
MRSFYILAGFPLAALATVNGHCSGDQATGEWRSKGICISTGTCTSYGGKYITGACPNDPDNIKCCLVGRYPSTVNPCGGLSWCDWTSNSCSGTRPTGYCPGGDNYRCCKI